MDNMDKQLSYNLYTRLRYLKASLVFGIFLPEAIKVAPL